MIGLFIAIAMVLGVGGTVAVSDNARPGDALFKIDRAMENARISLASKEEKNELRIRFAEERVKEVEEITEERQKVNDPVSSLSEEDKADVALGIENALDLLTDLDSEVEVEDVRLEELAVLLSGYLDNLPEDARVQVSDDRLRIKFDQGSDRIEIKDQGENKTKIDVRNGESRLRIEVKDGEIEIKTKIEDDDDSSGELEIEAKIMSDKTMVEVEIKDEKTTFATSADTEAGIIAAILSKFPTLTEARIKAVLEIETEDSDDDDSDNDSDEDEDSEDDSKDDDDSDEDSDDDREDDRSGSNSGSR